MTPNRQYLDGIIIIWNRSAQELYGYLWREAVGEPIKYPGRRCLDEVLRIFEKFVRKKKSNT